MSKEKYAAVCHRDKLRSPWKLDCESFGKLRSIVEVVSTCKHSGGRKRVKKLTSYTADAFKVTTEYNIEAAIYLLENYSFSYILSAIFSQDPLEKFFGQAKQRCGGNFYIDIVDVPSVAKMQILHQQLKHNLPPDACHSLKCPSCTEEVNPDDVDVVRTLTIADTQKLFDSEDQMKHKVIYIAGYIAKNHKLTDEDDSEECVSSTFLDELNRGGLTVPSLLTAFFVHCGVHAQKSIASPRLRCQTYMKLLSLIYAPVAQSMPACRSLANILLQSFVTANSDREKSAGCLRRKEKLTSK